MDQPHLGVVAPEWQTVWQEHAGWLRTVLRARVRNDDVADELLQAVSVSAWTHRDQLKDETRAGPWLYRIALRQVLMFWRSHGRERRRYETLDDAARSKLRDHRASDPLQWLTRQEVHQQIRLSLGRMSAQDREILMLKHAEHWTYAQIAGYLGLTMDKVIHRLARARARLKEQLLEWEIDGDSL
jgi:RNA polymerase sigma-70 factor (ECF subfamily)